eukprot:TRINITY_DN10924_c0_g1_i17.p1 TRINITY_DN10924_c0_g1~~TRINITY_DN10924_c0_g1_i17.p1  ORF type:complete len:117 (+),score=18.00 TRINITY_DN10924_c0_g1_i17:166-516(+)
MLLEDMACPSADKNDRKSKTPYLEQSDDNYTVCPLQEQESSASGCQNLRSQYLAFKDSFTGEEISRSESQEFYSVIIRAERLHKLGDLNYRVLSRGFTICLMVLSGVICVSFFFFS